MKFRYIAATCLTFAMLIPACSEDDPENSKPDAQSPDASSPAACNPDKGVSSQDNASCKPTATDFDSSNTDGDGWKACISDDGKYHPIEGSISSNARIAAFENIAKALKFDGSAIPTKEDFLTARKELDIDQGLGSRIERREDEHYPKAPNSKQCRDMSPDEVAAHKDRCIGPSTIIPLINKAISEGSKGNDLQLNAARVEAGLLWFLYLSVHKEAITCGDKPKDCDSSYAYYTGGENDKTKGKGLSRYVLAASSQAHKRVWEGILAVRCWRDLDKAAKEEEINKTLRDQAVKQLDTALLRGMAMIVHERLNNVNCATAFETIKILGPVLLREANARNADKAKFLKDQFAKTAAKDIDVAATKKALEEVFNCP